MFKLRNIIIIVLSLFIAMGCFRSDEEKRQDKVNKILTHMEKKYGEKFYMSSPFGGRGKNDTLRIMVKPERYRGSAREYDDFYEDYAFIKTDGKTGDGFGTVYLKEGAEEYFKPKLKELFGENVLITIVPEGRYVFVDFKEEMKRRSKVYNSNPIGNYSPLSGGIYIFGRVENEADREYYRKQIYEFIQYLKAENMFDYVNIEFHVKDERMLSKGFNENIEDRNKIIAEKNFVSTKTRGLIYQKYEDDFKNTPQKYINNHLNNIRKSNVREETYFSDLLYLNLLSEKLIKSRGWDKNDRINAKIKTYSNLNDVEFNLEGWGNQE